MSHALLSHQLRMLSEASTSDAQRLRAEVARRLVGFPVYVPSLGRADTARGPRTLLAGGVLPTLVVQPHEADLYRAAFIGFEVLVLPPDVKGIGRTREWIKRTSEARGEQAHWQVDDDVTQFATRDPFQKVPAAEAMGYVEELFRDHPNVAAACLSALAWPSEVPYLVNHIVYSCELIRNGLPFYHRPDCIDDVDYTLQVLSAGYCTIVSKRYRMSMPNVGSTKGGNQESGYYDDRNRKTAEGTAALWPGLVRVVERFGLHKAHVVGGWRQFKQKLERGGT